MTVRGFTLLELIVVMGILAALSVLSIPQIFRYNDNQSLQSASSDLQQALRTAQSNALSGVICSSNYSDLASSKWSLAFNNDAMSYKTEATCVDNTRNPAPQVIPSTKTLPAGVEISEIWIDSAYCGSDINIPVNTSGKKITFDTISGRINFNDTNLPPDCSILTSSKEMWVGLRLTEDISKKIYVVINKGGSIYVSSGAPSL